MEMQLLCLLDYDLGFNELEVCKVFSPFMGPSVVIESTVSVATRASALNKVTEASKVRAEAQQRSQANVQVANEKVPQPPAQSLNNPSACSASSAGPAPSSASSASALTSAVRGIARRLSTAHLRQPASSGASVIYSNRNSKSSSSASSSSDLVSLVDDTGSSSSSSGWTSNESDTDEANIHKDNHAVAIADPNVPLSDIDLNLDHNDICAGVGVNANLAGPGTMKKTFSLRPSIPQFKALAPQQTSIIAGNDDMNLDDVTPTKARKPSDTSSVHTVTSPMLSRKACHTVRGAVTGMTQNEGKRSLDKKPSTSSISRKETLPASLTMPSIVQSSSTIAGSAFAPAKERLRSGTVAHRPSASKGTAPRTLSPPPSSLLLHSHPSSSSGCLATSSSSLIGTGTGTAKGHPSMFTATRASGVGAIISRMWGAAAANLKGVGQRGHHPAQTHDHTHESQAIQEAEVEAGHISRSDDISSV